MAKTKVVPSTKRSKLTVDAILQAFAALCEQYGYDEVTTNLVAERAGVSVGSIYQYFPNKQAIAVGLIEEASSRVAIRLRETILGGINETLDQTVRKTLAVLLDCMQRERKILIDLVEASPSLREAARNLSVVDLIERSSRIYLEQHQDEIGPRGTADGEKLRYFMGTIVKGAIRDYLVKPPPGLTPAAFVDEVARILVLYAKS
jgi:AcrR family transcriptional regulator